MLLNFCNPNQLLAAITIDGSVLTFFFRPDTNFECDAFASYMKEVFKIKISPGTSLTEKNHESLIHRQSYHLMRLSHQHLDFGFAIDKKLGLEIIAKIKKYQAANSVSIRQYYQTKQRQKKLSYIEMFYATTNYLKNLRVSVNPNSPILSTKNFKRLETELSKLPEQKFSSSPQIINFLNKTLEKHDFSHPSSLPIPARLKANTCPQLNGLVQTQDEAVDVMFSVFNTTLFALSSAYAMFIYFRYLKPQAPVQNEQPEPRQLQPRRSA